MDNPVPTKLPPLAAVYQFTVAPNEVAADKFAVKVTEPASQRLAGVVEDIVGTLVIIVATKPYLLADLHPFAVEDSA